jgi:prepilin-type N-terminal cleavage/methylation domain-containing protein
MRMVKNPVRDEGGFTLIEILIAMAVFSIAVLGISAMQTSSIRGNMQARVIGEKALEASSQVEALNSLSYNDVGLTDGTYTDGDFSWIVTTVNLDVENEYKTVALTLTWPLRGADKTVTINLIKSHE